MCPWKPSLASIYKYSNIVNHRNRNTLPRPGNYMTNKVACEAFLKYRFGPELTIATFWLASQDL